MRPIVISVTLLAGLASGCEGRMAEPPAAPATPEPASSFPQFSRDELLAMSRPLRFRAADGVLLEGRVFGDGDVGIVLDHMGEGDQSQWWGLAGLLSDRGYRVLTYDRRGSCPGGELGCSRGEDVGDGWKDVVGAVDALRTEGADRVAVGGASLGAMESLYALARGGADADGLLWVAGADLYGGMKATRLVREVDGPKLFLAGAFEREFAELAAQLHRAASPPTHLVLLDTGEHGTDILAYDEPAITDRFQQAVLNLMATLD